MLRAIGDHVGLLDMDGIVSIRAGHPWQVQVRPTVAVFLRWARSLGVSTVVVDHGYEGAYYVHASGQIAGMRLDLMLVLLAHESQDFARMAKLGLAGPITTTELAARFEVATL